MRGDIRTASRDHGLRALWGVPARGCPTGRGHVRRPARPLGFTLIELLVYLMIISVVLVSATAFASEFLGIQAKAEAYREVQRASRLATSRVLTEMREATGIDAATAYGDPGTLAVTTANGVTSPTTFSVTGAVLYVQQGTNPALPLTPSDLEVRSFDVTDLSVTGRTKLVRVKLTLGSRNATGVQDVQAEVTTYASARIRVGDGFSN